MNRDVKQVVVVIAALLTVHVGCGLIAWVGTSTAAVVAFIAMYLLRGFGVTAGYHRYFAHRAFATGRALQFVFGLLGTFACQGGLLWWVARHREHHRHTDTPDDPHTPVRHGFWYAHLGWLFSARAHAPARYPARELLRFPELCWLQRHYLWLVLVPLPLLYGLGEWLAIVAAVQTSGLQLVIWGYFLSQVVVWHSTFMVNSVCHLWGTAPHPTGDTSRNNALVALVTLGEGWHNNHHYAPVSARQGLRWYEFDPTWLLLRLLAALGLVWNLRSARVAHGP